MKNNQEVVLATCLTIIATQSAKVEQLAVKRQQIKNPETGILGELKAATDAQLLEIKTASDEAKEKIVNTIKSLDVADACKIVSSVCASPDGADKVIRQRLNRRRNALQKHLEGIFTQYDFVRVKRNNRASLEYNFIGDDAVREAKELMSVIARLEKFGVTISDVSQDGLATAIRSEQGTTLVVAPVNDNTPSAMHNRGELESIIKTFTAGAETSKEALQRDVPQSIEK